MAKVLDTLDAERPARHPDVAARTDTDRPASAYVRRPSILLLSRTPRHRRRSISRCLLIVACRRAEALAPQPR